MSTPASGPTSPAIRDPTVEPTYVAAPASPPVVVSNATRAPTAPRPSGIPDTNRLPIVFNEEFDGVSGNAPDQGTWHVTFPGPPDVGRLELANGQLELTGRQNGFYMAIGTVCSVGGDFDVSVKYSLLTESPKRKLKLRLLTTNLPTSDVGLYVGLGPSVVARSSYGALAEPSVTGRSGVLRLIRTGSLILSYHGDGPELALIGLVQSDVDATGFLIEFADSSDTRELGVVMALDDFRIAAERIGCPPEWQFIAPTPTPTPTPSPVPTATRVPAPTTTATPAGAALLPQLSPAALPTTSATPIGLSFTFGTDVGDAERERIRDGAAAARDFIRSEVGITADSAMIFVFRDAGALTDAYARWFGITNAQHIDSIRQQRLGGFTASGAGVTAEATYRVIFIYTGSSGWDSTSRPADLTLTHEYFHVVQNELLGREKSNQAQTTPPGQLRLYGPTWLMEGSAELVTWLADSGRTGTSMASVRDRRIAETRSTIATLSSMETNAGFQTVPASYQMGLLATEFLVQANGLSSLASYYSAIGQGTLWQTAFQQAFGVTPDQFYPTFEEYRARGFR